MTNRLAGATSPYLRQHAGNPVDWQPWGDEALARSRAENKPILLSIGYSACHWCHVMAHESFEDPAVAAVMNEHFVNIKVDREERPDLDQIYQTAHALMTRRSGGWPLTMFLTPTGTPFFAGTYFPKQGRYGLPGFLDLLPRVAAAYQEKGVEIAQQGTRLTEAMASIEPASGDGALPMDAAAQALAGLKTAFRPRIRRLRRGAQVPAPDRTRVLPARVGHGARRRGAAVVRDVARLHGRRRHLRPLGRRVLPLFGRCAMDHSAFRKDALRQRPIAGAVCGRCARDRRPAVRGRRARHRRVAGARDARCRRQRPRRVLLEPRCRQRRRGGQVLRVVAGRSARYRFGRRMGGGCAAFRPRAAAEFRRARVAPARDRAIGERRRTARH